jgi:Ser/Thr protein kinase RdoA (MazF antagonist)
MTTMPSLDAAPAVLSASLVANVATIELDEAEQFVATRYGIAGKASPLTSERDRNFKLTAGDGAEYVLKVANARESRDVTNLQTAALLHIASAAPSLPVQRVVHALNGDNELMMRFSDGTSGVARLLSFIPGEVLRFSKRSAAQRRNLGRMLARIGIALRDFHHPAAGHELAWDLQHAGKLRTLLPDLAEGDERRSLIVRCLDTFDKSVLPRLGTLRAQIVHNDLNRNNVIVDPADNDRIVAILDFGDMVHTPLINDVAIGAANQLSDSDNPLDTAIEFIAGYSETVPLASAEIDLLYDLVCTRLVMSVVITGWRAARFPERREHILRNTPANWSRLANLAAMPREDAISALRQACKNG